MEIRHTTTPEARGVARRGAHLARRGAAARVRGFPLGLRRGSRARGPSTGSSGRSRARRRWLEPAWPHEYGGAELSPRGAQVVREEFGRRRAGGHRGHRHVGRARPSSGSAPTSRRPPSCPGWRPARSCGARATPSRMPGRIWRPDDARRAGRRRMGDQRREDLLHGRSPLQLDHHRGPHRSRLFQAPPGNQLLRLADGRPRHRAAAPVQHRRRPPEPGVPRRGAGARQPACSETSTRDGTRSGSAWAAIPSRASPTTIPDPRRTTSLPLSGCRGCSTSSSSTAGPPTRNGAPAQRGSGRAHAADRSGHRGRDPNHARLRGRAATYGPHLHQAITKEFQPRFAQTCMDILGPLGQIQSGPWAPLAGEIDRIYRRSFGNHAGGTSQLKRMVVATRALGLPR